MPRVAQRRPGSHPRRQPGKGLDLSGRLLSLNEGRGVIPGDSSVSRPGEKLAHWAAQRRPGSHPRRQGRDRGGGEDRQERSTKAGESSPATGAARKRERDQAWAAQRRPGSHPRRQALPGIGYPRGRVLRSTKAGESSPATAEYFLPALRQPVSRSTKAGESSPATGRPPRRMLSAASALNEGRGVIPGDRPRRGSGATGEPGTLNEGRGVIPGDSREEPVMLRCRFRPLNEGRGVIPGDSPSIGSVSSCKYHALNEGRGVIPGDSAPNPRLDRPLVARSTKAGESSPATVNGGKPSREGRRLRSTKAGESSPATAVRLTWETAEEMTTLNEGRGVIPGDSPRCWTSGSPPGSLNEGRGVIPGDSRLGRGPAGGPGARSTKAGESSPATASSGRQG